MVTLLLCLQYDWDTLDDYLLKRPWHHIFHMNWETVMTAFTQRGLFKYEHIKNILILWLKYFN